MSNQLMPIIKPVDQNLIKNIKKLMTVQEQNMQEFEQLQYQYLAEAIDLFGPKIDYEYIGLFYHNFAPRVVMHDYDFLTDSYFYKIELCGKAINDRTDGIFQLSHEVVHLLSP